MNFLFPVFLGAAALTALPFLLHLLRLQPRRRIPFPSLRFLGRAALRDANRHRLRRWLTLLLRFAIILLIVAAFSRPFWPHEHSDKSRAVVVVIDNSYSMQTAGRIDAVKAWLAPQIDSLRAPDELGVIVLHPAPVWLVPLSRNLETGRSAVFSWPKAFERSHFRPGLDLAAVKLSLSAAKEKQILLAADQQQLGWSRGRFERTLPPGINLYPAPPASMPARQAAVTGLKAGRTSDGQISLEATVRNFTDSPDERTVTFYSGGEPLGSAYCELPAGRSQTVQGIYRVRDPAAPLMLSATIETDDLSLDDTAYAALAGVGDRRVILARGGPGAETDFLALALGAVGSGERRRGRLPGLRVDPLPESGPWASSTVAILRGAAPFRGESLAALDDFLAAGGSAWVLCDGSEEQGKWLATHGVTVGRARSPTRGKLKLRDLALDHPLFAPFVGYSISSLLAPTFHRGWALEGESVEPLARWSDRTVAFGEMSVGLGRVFITGFGESRADSTFPVEAAYVPFVHQTVAWLSQSRMAAPVGGRVGETLVLPGEGTWRAVQTPQPVEPVAVDGLVTAAVPGLYAFEQPGAWVRYYAINLDHAESDLSAWPTPEDFRSLVSLEEEPTRTLHAQVADRTRVHSIIDERLVDERGVWWWLLAAAVMLLFFELPLANRTIP